MTSLSKAPSEAQYRAPSGAKSQYRAPSESQCRAPSEAQYRIQQLLNNRPNKEEMAAAREEKKASRLKKINEAVKHGATVNYVTCPILGPEQETHITIDIDGNLDIDTTLSPDINKCIDSNYEIVAITYYKGISENYDGRIAGIRFKADRKCLTFRKR